MDLVTDTHRRLDPLTGRWILVSPHRTQRPWQGREEQQVADERPTYDHDCYLCPGNERAGGERNPDYTGTFVFTNDFAALSPHTGTGEHNSLPYLQAHGQPGTCRVLCFHPRHDLTLARMTVEQISSVVDLWVRQVQELATEYRWVQLFENRGAAMGASNPHPHGQLWAMTELPTEVETEDRQQRTWRQELGRPLLVDYARSEQGDGSRVVVENDDWVVVVPFWAVWPFEVMVLPRRHVPRLTDLTPAEQRSLAAVLRSLLIRYDNLFRHPFPYSMGWHGAPGQEGGEEHWQLHAHFYPPLLRSASVRKFMVGFEMLGEAQRDLSPEDSASRLRELPDVHYASSNARSGA